MELVLFLLVSVLERIHITSLQQTNSEDINKILEKLIQQTANNGTDSNYNGENPNISEPHFPVPIDAEAETGNDSSIYYLKTNMAPRIKYKTPPVKRRSNRPIKNIEVNRRYEALSEDEIITGTALPHSSQTDGETNPEQEKTDEVDKNFHTLENLLQTDFKKKPSTERSPYGHVIPKPMSLLHDYPEIVIDHISYNNDKDKPPSIPTNAKEPQNSPHEPNPTKYNIDGNILTLKYTPKSVNQGIELPVIQKYLPDDSDSNPDTDVDGLVKHRNKAVTDEGEANKQNVMLKMILDRLPAKKPQEEVPRVKDESRSLVAYPVGLNTLSSVRDIGGLGILSDDGNLEHNVVTYAGAPILAPAWSPYRQATTVPYLPAHLLGLTRLETLQRRRLVTALVRRVIPRYTIRRTLPVFYGL